MAGLLDQFPGARALLLEFFKEVGPMLVRELQQSTTGDEFVDQYRSPLRLPNQKSSRRHCAIVRRRIAEGRPGALISPDGKQFFLTTAALAEEMGCASAPALAPLVKAAPTAEPCDEGEDGYARILRVVQG